MVRSAGVSARPLGTWPRCAAGGRRAGRLERELVAAGRVVELHPVRVEPVGVESTSEPLEYALVLLVGGVLDHRQKVLVAVHAAAVLGRAGPGAVDTEGILLAWLPRQDRLERQLVFPPIAEVILVRNGGAGTGEVAGNGNLPARQRGLFALERVGVRYADLLYVARCGPSHTEDVQMVVEPAHRVLKGDVQIPEAVGLGHLDSPPDGRFHPDEDELELVNLRRRRHPAARRLTPDEGLLFELVV